LLPSSLKFTEHSFKEDRRRVFDAVLAVAQECNLSVKVLEKNSGLIRFESSNLSPGQLDIYAYYPYVYENTKDEYWNFQEWAKDPRTADGERTHQACVDFACSVTGILTLNVLVKETQNGSSVNLRSSIAVVKVDEKYSCRSKGVLEKAFFEDLKEKLSQPFIEQQPEEKATTNAHEPAAAGCVYDIQCKGDRICENGKCVSP
jgi:hypothetical protein